MCVIAWLGGLQFMAGGDLHSALQRDVEQNADGERSLGWYERGRLVLVGVARGLAYLHQQRVRRGRNKASKPCAAFSRASACATDVHHEW